jgi:hypothetical protein
LMNGHKAWKMEPLVQMEDVHTTTVFTRHFPFTALALNNCCIIKLECLFFFFTFKVFKIYFCHKSSYFIHVHWVCTWDSQTQVYV